MIGSLDTRDQPKSKLACCIIIYGRLRKKKFYVRYNCASLKGDANIQH